MVVAYSSFLHYYFSTKLVMTRSSEQKLCGKNAAYVGDKINKLHKLIFLSELYNSVFFLMHFKLQVQ